MKSNSLSLLFILFSLFIISKTLDNSTLSNYKNITLKRLEGIFEPDFNSKIVKGKLTYTFLSNIKGDKIILDTKYLLIISVKDAITGENYNFTKELEKEDESLGTPLIIFCPYELGQEINITIEYETTENGTSTQFLNKEQTFGGKYEYFFTMSEMIIGRELLPSQDTPAVKFPFYLGIKVPTPLIGMISGLFDKEEEDEYNKTKTFYYKQEIPVPNYLIALAAGNIKEMVINENISVYSEPEFVQNVYDELYDFLPDILEKSITYMGEYEWEKYNVLVLPKSFPYSGMENPCLSFCSPCLINGDKSLVDIIAHELIHSWSGNLVTNENWRDFWINEGITMFLQREVIGMWKGEDYAKMDAILGLFYIEEYLDIFGENSTYTTLRPEYDGQSPDDFYSDIPYEKGYNFMYFIKNLLGNETMKQFFQSYFIHFKYKSLDLYDFKKYFIQFCQNNNIAEDILSQIDWDGWIYTPGRCFEENNFTNKYMIEVNKSLDKFLKGEIDEDLETTFNNWTHTSKTVFMNTLEQREEFLTEKQHEFMTKTLKLYDHEKQNFLVQTNYFRLILAKTDKFYEYELESLIYYLSNYGAVDYMTGIYGLFYRRDEELSIKTLDSLRSFYHPLMIKEAEEEIEYEKENFPILSLDLKNDNECSFFQNLTNIEIISNGYNKSLEIVIDIENGVYLKSRENYTFGLQCHLDNEDKYCKLTEEINNSGTYNLYIPYRIQNQSYAIKKFEGNNQIKIYLKESIIDEIRTQSNYNISIKGNETKIIEIYFLAEPDNTIKVMLEEKEIEYELINETMKCKINKDIFNLTKEDNYVFELKIVDLCGSEIYSFKVSIYYKEEEDKNNGKLKAGYIVLIVFGCILVIALVTFLIYRAIRRKKVIEPEQSFESSNSKLLPEVTF